MPDNSTPRPVMLTILDGWGLSDSAENNAVAQARTPNFDRLMRGPHTRLVAHGVDVGLPPGVMGNSEVGHLNIGAGRIVFQDSSLIDQSIRTNEFFQNENLLAAIQKVKENDTRLHLLGLTSNGNVHASEGHYFALLEMAARHGLKGDKVVFHVFTDGRDTPPQSGLGYVSRLLEQMMKTGTGCVGSVVGRYYAMDRDTRWPRVRQAYELLTEGIGHNAPDAITAIKSAYERGETDEFIGATAILDAQGNPRPRVLDGDAVIFFNYRSDRGRELTDLFLDPDFDADLPDSPPDAERAPFKRDVRPAISWTTMTRYSEDQTAPYAFGPRPQRDGLGETVAKAGKTQLRIAETEKYPHVTFFFSGGMETPWHGEERSLVNSPDVATYDLQPEMSEPEVAQTVKTAIESGELDLIILNFANPDMVGHTGILSAAVAACEATDEGLGFVMDAIEKVDGALIVIADHGNCELMVDPVTGEPHTAHTTNPVPCALWGNYPDGAVLRGGGRLADIAPTLLDLMNLEKPAAMTGISLLATGMEQVDIVEADVAGLSFADALQKASAQKVNPALARAEVMAALGQSEERLAAAVQGRDDALALDLEVSARGRAELLES